MAGATGGFPGQPGATNPGFNTANPMQPGAAAPSAFPQAGNPAFNPSGSTAFNP